MPSTMETFAKMAGVTAGVGGGISKITKMLSGEAKMEKNLKKRQAAEAKDQTKLIIAEEKEIHKNWLREKGSWIQAVKDAKSGYTDMTIAEREQGEEERIQKVKDAIKDKELRKRLRASKRGGLEEEEFQKQHEFNENTKAARQAEKDLKKDAKAQIKKDELRLAKQARDYYALKVFDDESEKDILSRLKEEEAKDKKAQAEEDIAVIQEKFLDGSSVRLKNLVKNLKNDEIFAGKFKDMDDEHLIQLIQKGELTKKENARLTEIEGYETSLLGLHQELDTSSRDENEPDNENRPPGVTGANVTGAPGAGVGNNEDIVTAIEDLTIYAEDSNVLLGKGLLINKAIAASNLDQVDHLIEGLGLHSPPFLETLTKTEPGAPSVEGENIGIESAPDTNGVNGSEVGGSLAEVITAEEALPVESDQIEELIEIEKKGLDYDRRKDQRDVKAAGKKLEAGRDKGFSVGKGGSPTLMKAGAEKGGSMLGNLAKIFFSPLGRIGMALTGLTTGVGVLTTASGLLTTATTSIGNFTSRLLPNWMKKMIPGQTPTAPGAPGRAPASRLSTMRKGWDVKAAGKATGGGGAGAATELAKTGSKISRIGKGATKLLGKAAIPLTVALSAFEIYSTEQREDLDRTEKNIAHTKTGGGLGGGIAGSMAGAAIGTAIFPVVGTIIGGLIGGGLGYFLGGEIGETVAEEISDKTDTEKGEKYSKLDPADKDLLMKDAEKSGIVDVGLGHGTIEDIERLAKLDLSSIEALLDQETWSKEDEEKLHKIRNAKMEGRELEVTKGSWWEGTEDQILAQEKGTAGPSVNVDEKLERLRKEKKSRGRGYQQYAGYGKKSKLSPEAGAAIAQAQGREMTPDEIEQAKLENDQFDVQYAEGGGEGVDAEDIAAAGTARKRLTGREKMKKKAAKMRKKAALHQRYKSGEISLDEYNKQRTGVSTAVLNDVRKGSGNENLVEPTDEVYTGLLDEDKKLVETDFMKQNAKFQHGQYTRKDADSPSINMEATDLPGKNPLEVAINAAKKEGEEALTPKRFDDLTINKDEADTFYKAGNAIGSIFTHDTHTEQALWDIWAEEKSFFNPKSFDTTVGIEGEKELPFADGSDFSPQLNMFGNQPNLMAPVPIIDVSPNAPELTALNEVQAPSGILEQGGIALSQAKAPEAVAKGAAMINAPIINNKAGDTTVIQAPSTAHGPAPAGTNKGR